MQPTIEILDRIRKNSRDNKEEIFTRLYRYLLRPDLYYLAYKNLYANKGAGPKGVNDDTADGFSKEKVDRIIQSLADGTYTPNPVRREYMEAVCRFMCAASLMRRPTSGRFPVWKSWWQQSAPARFRAVWSFRHSLSSKHCIRTTATPSSAT